MSNAKVFNDQEHEKAFISLCPGKLQTDQEWIAPIYIITSDAELRAKAMVHVEPERREIRWQKIFDTDFGSGHYAALYWAFSLWAGNSWVKEDGSIVDTMDRSYSMDEKLKRTSIFALKLRWFI
ncbi:hypothetical protein Desaci_4775 (plasmid) [Desulfosporosinus acidiphilus SJ4]|uniref:Uncharacterized protein n=1 Tax=Desulfosporosinus acidiphilus (strain DSM 22704 / JCM 16185 / SJ4) TaxID=646529 RepID=I4DCS6_DESAJ|nr:DUF6075 family protein [Desulfosporosinus acidiphilus]AFM43600.1 hypothetical protein Desaci_4775 [Desulfosporosinus acidiphilus SJ4]